MSGGCARHPMITGYRLPTRWQSPTLALQDNANHLWILNCYEAVFAVRRNGETMNKVTIIHPRLQHLGMTTADTDAMLHWYQTVLGMSLVHRTSSATGDQKSGPNLMGA